jgi:hypothetical protein
MARQKIGATGPNSSNKITYGLPTRKTRPAITRIRLRIIVICLNGHFGRLTMPSRFANFLKPWLDHLGARMMFQKWCGRLARSQEWTDKHMIKSIVLQSLTKDIGLAKAQC